MSHNYIEIKEGAFLLSDAHYSSERPELLEFIKAIHSKKLQPTQLIFLGDIFDALFGSIEYTIQKNTEVIALLKDISQDIELIYLEGNHDFNLKNLFSDAKIFSIKEQPISVKYSDKKILLAHGDFNGALGYRVYTSIIRNPYLLPILNVLNNIFNNFILKNLDTHLDKKDDCKEFYNFKEYISKRLVKSYECDYFIEGHFHQNRTLEFENFNYINLAAFACNQRYFIVKSLKDKEFLEEKIFSKEI